MTQAAPTFGKFDEIMQIAKISEIGLADSLFEMYTIEELIIKREFLLRLQAEVPNVSKLKISKAIYTAIRWKEMEEERGYAPH